MKISNFTLALLAILISLNVMSQVDPIVGVVIPDLSNYSGCLRLHNLDTSGTANFEKKKGHLIIPTSHHSNVAAEHHSDETTRGCTFSRNGMDITCGGHAHAISVAEGRVTAVIISENIRAVIIKHGRYFSVYSNLEDVTVVKGQSIAEYQMIGSIMTQDDKTILHFELWLMSDEKETIELDPKDWFEVGN